jgi:2-polyprenyl-3-methyl-5-hydroxy-6-metoxy-1,4-benzoquinol methylase
MQIDGRDYWHCPKCDARFLDPAQRLPASEELAHYRTHRNSVDDPAYRDFLSRLATPLLARLTPGQSGLDYGCGPGPALAAMLKEAGHEMAVYDPFFAPDRAVLDRSYDFISCTETAEHFHNPADEFDRLGGLLRPGGWLALMTCLHTEETNFAKWYYRKDPTHVVFYAAQTMRQIATIRGWSYEFPANNVVLMRKS